MKPMQGWLLAGLLLVLLTAWWMDVGHYLRLETIQANLEALTTWRAQHPLIATTAFFGAYVLITAFSIPGAALMTLLAGALFGLGWGLLLVSFASSLGALAAFLIARYLLRTALEQRFAETFARVNRGIEQEGAYYLLMLRLVPVFPFFLINLAMACTRLRAWTFYWVSQLGMLAGTAVYVNAGQALSEVRQMQDLLSIELWIALSLLGVFPWLAKRGVDRLKARQRLRAWRRPKRFDRNVIVIGAGAGGLVSAYLAAAAQAQVTLIERDAMGGDCLNTGCVPSKTLIHLAKLAQTTGSVPDWASVQAAIARSIAEIAPHDSVERYQGLGVDVRLGAATLLDPWTVEITDASGQTSRLTAPNLILATGAKPNLPDVPGRDQVEILTSDTLWSRLLQSPSPPQSLCIVGGGAIGCELAQALARLGIAVTLLEQAERVMPQEDPEVSAAMQAALEQDGVVVMTQVVLQRFSRRGSAIGIHLLRHSELMEIESHWCLAAMGRTPSWQGLGLERLGISDYSQLAIQHTLQTCFPHLYVVGDVSGRMQYTHFAAHQAWTATVNALLGGVKRFRVDERVIPAVTFTQPALARVGLNTAQARAQGIAYEETRCDLRSLDRAIMEDRRNGWITVLTEPGRDRVLGVTIFADAAGEMIAEMALAMRHGLGLSQVLSTCHAYPTWNEANKMVAGAWKKAHAPTYLYPYLRFYHKWRRGSER